MENRGGERPEIGSVEHQMTPEQSVVGAPAVETSQAQQPGPTPSSEAVPDHAVPKVNEQSVTTELSEPAKPITAAELSTDSVELADLEAQVDGLMVQNTPDV